ncbi:MAG TPA: helix-turn-helix domain-containing protein [Acidimicrobiia bacterium]
MTPRPRLPDPELARVLADPTRRHVLDLVIGAPEPIGVAELTDAVGLHHNAIRQHLAQLCAAGLVVESHEERHTPGRPRLLYRASRTSPRDSSAQYRRLARLLLRVARTGASPREVGRVAGRESAPASRAITDPVAALEHETARDGFMPTRVEGNGRTELVLDHCPIADVAAEDPATVCALHRGLAEGFLDAVGGAPVVTLAANDPHRAGCRIGIATTRPLKERT